MDTTARKGHRHRDAELERLDSLDVLIVLTELLVVEPELIHEVGRHLLDLIVREGLRGGREGGETLHQLVSAQSEGSFASFY